jgi:hypothetical protein
MKPSRTAESLLLDAEVWKALSLLSIAMGKSPLFLGEDSIGTVIISDVDL